MAKSTSHTINASQHEEQIVPVEYTQAPTAVDTSSALYHGTFDAERILIQLVKRN